MDLMKTLIKTESLKLQPIEFKYAQEIFNEFTDELTQYMIPQPSEDINVIFEFIKISLDGLKDGSNLQLIALKKDTHEFIGCIGLHKLDTSTPELGIWIKKSAHGNGFGLEAITELVNWAKKNIQFEYLKYPVDKRNYASKRIPEKNGGLKKREFNVVNPKGFELDIIEYWIYK